MGFTASRLRSWVMMSPVKWLMLDPKSTVTRKAIGCRSPLKRCLINSVSWTTRATEDEGGLQQFALVASGQNTTSKLPDNITEDQAATIPTALNTAFIALYDPTNGFGFPSPFEGGETFGHGKSFLVMGGSSVIGLLGSSYVISFRK